MGYHAERDYQAHNVWPKLGFSPIHSKLGRNKKGLELTFWWKDHYQPDLFSRIEEEDDERLSIVVDANVFYDLEDSQRLTHEESAALVADWIEPHLRILLTEEMFNEADRLEGKVERKEAKKRVRSYERAKADQSRFVETLEEVRKYFPEDLSEQDKSDIRHLAWTIASGVLFFVTRDQFLLDMHEVIYANFRVSILRPVELIVRFDDLFGEARSQPVRLAGTLLDFQEIRNYDEGLYLSDFFNNASGEKKRNLKALLRKYFSNPDKYEVKSVSSGINNFALVVFDRSHSGELHIPLYRISSKPEGPTIAYNLVLHVQKLAAQENRTIVRVSDQFLEPNIINRLKEDRFLKVADGWIKICVDQALDKNQLVDYLQSISQESNSNNYVSNLIEAVDEAKIEDDKVLSDLERTFWPVKIIDSEIPTFIVSIHPQWAMHLFDEKLASQDLFGARPDLALNREGVYYKARFPDGRPLCTWKGDMVCY